METTRQKECANCGIVYAYTVRRGCERIRSCSPVCRKALYKRRMQEYRRVGALRSCRVEGCGRPVARPRPQLCEGCYCRIRRNGDASWPSRAPRPPRLHSHGYVILSSPGHPLAGGSGCVGEHRLTLYDAIGGGAHPCHWCGCTVEWKGEGSNCLVVDHLNDIKADNRPENLVPSCNDCNRARGAMLPFIRRLCPESLDQFLTLIRECHAQAGEHASPLTVWTNSVTAMSDNRAHAYTIH